MRRAPDPRELAAALGRRLRAVAPVLAPGCDERRPGALLDRMVRGVMTEVKPEHVWLLSTALTTVMPDQDAMRRLLRGLRRRPEPGDALRFLLDVTASDARNAGDIRGDLLLVTGEVLVDVDFTARHDLHTGVQRTVRELLPRWHRDRVVRPVGWTSRQGSLCRLSDTETARVLAWSGDPLAMADPVAPGLPTLVVPWRSVLVLAEVLATVPSARVAALAQFSGSSVVALGYDTIPVVSAQLLPHAEPEKFTQYLTAVKHLRRVAGISATAASEFAGFATMLPGQGLAGPELVAAPLPVAAHRQSVPVPSAVPDAVPLVLCVGTLDARKNPLATLFAAEVLWREGLQFRLHFVVGGGARAEGQRRVDELAAAGRPVTASRGVTEASLESLYAAARFTVFPSLHEGYGLPVAESIDHGVPVITSSYGSTAEIAAEGGALVVDPRNDAELVAAMRRLLTDDDLLAELQRQIAARPKRSWDDYAAELWDVLVVPELAGTLDAAGGAAS